MIDFSGIVLGAPAFRSILAGQMDDPVCVVEPDAGLGKVREWDRLRVNLQPIAVAACECGCLVGVDLQIPNLNVFPLDRDDVSLCQCNLIQQPICACVLDDIFHAFGVKHLPDKAVTIVTGTYLNEPTRCATGLGETIGPTPRLSLAAIAFGGARTTDYKSKW